MRTVKSHQIDGVIEPGGSQYLVRALIFTIACLLVVYSAVALLDDWDNILTTLAILPPILYLHVIGLVFLSYLLRFFRWQRFLFLLDYRIPLYRSAEIYFSAFALTLTPGKVGETVRSVYLARYSVSYANSIGAFFCERLLDLISVCGLALLGARLFPPHQNWLYATATVALAFFLIFRTNFNAFARKIFKHPLIVNGAYTINLLLKSRNLFEAGFLSITAWVAQAIALYLIVQSLGYTHSAITIISIYCISLLAGAASFVPGGLGTTEATMVLLLVNEGMIFSDAIVASLLCRTLTLWLAILMGMYFMTRLTLSSPRQRPAALPQSEDPLSEQG